MLGSLRVAALVTLLTLGILACERQSGGRAAPQVPEPGGPVEPTGPKAETPPNPPPASTGRRVPLTHATLFVPEGAGPGARVPFVLLLHGLGHTGEALEEQLLFDELALKRRFAYVAPDGTPDSSGHRFWNGWIACCDFERLNPDHVSLLRALLEEVGHHPAIDPRRRYVLGYSNGGFMAHRLACEVPGIAAIASISGSGPSDEEACRPPAPVAILQVHGDADPAIRYEGGVAANSPTEARHPGAEAVVAAWAARNGCSTPAEAPTPIDLEPDFAGTETLVTRYPGCQRDVELWRVRGGKHSLALRPSALEQVIAFLERYRTD